MTGPSSAGRSTDRPASASLSDRDLSIVRLVTRLHHVTSAHVHELIFLPNTTDRMPCQRALTRLLKHGYLDRHDKRPIGGTKGGSAYYIYRLGRRGHFVFSDEPYRARRQPVEHSLAVADVVVILRQLERQGLTIHAVHSEPDCHMRLGGVDLKPDLFVDLDLRRGRTRIFVETDMATQGRKRIMQKFGLYMAARARLSDAEYQAWNPWPTVLFIAVDEERRRELNYLLRDVGEDDRRMFMVTTREALPTLLGQV